MQLTRSSTLAGATLACSLLFTPVPNAIAGDGNHKLTIYFTRHAEKKTLTTPAVDDNAMDARSYTGIAFDDIDETYEAVPAEGIPPVSGKIKGKRLDEVCYKKKCAEVLSDKGEMRAMLLAGRAVPGTCHSPLESMLAERGTEGRRPSRRR